MPHEEAPPPSTQPQKEEEENMTRNQKNPTDVRYPTYAKTMPDDLRKTCQRNKK